MWLVLLSKYVDIVNQKCYKKNLCESSCFFLIIAIWPKFTNQIDFFLLIL